MVDHFPKSYYWLCISLDPHYTSKFPCQKLSSQISITEQRPESTSKAGGQNLGFPRVSLVIIVIVIVILIVIVIVIVNVIIIVSIASFF